MAQWEAVIGLEVHARLLTGSKLFCGCSTAFGAPPNTQGCPVCLGYPGALPVLNRRAVELTVRMAAAASCQIHPRSVFARKNYFYPDLPKGYQISQYDRPLATNGTIEFGDRKVRIHRIHIEEDAGKLLHADDGSLVDLNRAGTPLIEIVSEPDIRSAEEAVAYLTRLRQVLMYTGACDGNMEEGSLRCDANVSVRRPGDPFGTRTEVKNLNSFRYVGRAIEYEMQRQVELLESGGRVTQETLLYDQEAGRTRVMRSKEEAHDYRYFPEPDLPPLDLDRDWVEAIAREVPELPAQRSRRYQRDWNLGLADAEALVASRSVAEYFEQVAAAADARLAANWVRNDVLRILNERGIEIGECRISPAALAQLIEMVQRGAIGSRVAREVFDEMAETGEAPRAIVEKKGLLQVSDPAAIREAATRVVASNPAQVAQYRAGKTQVLGYLVGQLMKETRGKANAELANTILRELLGDGSRE